MKKVLNKPLFIRSPLTVVPNKPMPSLTMGSKPTQPPRRLSIAVERFTAMPAGTNGNSVMRFVLNEPISVLEKRNKQRKELALKRAAERRHTEEKEKKIKMLSANVDRESAQIISTHTETEKIDLKKQKRTIKRFSGPLSQKKKFEKRMLENLDQKSDSEDDARKHPFNNRAVRDNNLKVRKRRQSCTPTQPMRITRHRLSIGGPALRLAPSMMDVQVVLKKLSKRDIKEWQRKSGFPKKTRNSRHR